MIKLDDLWIGDELKIISSGRIGTFEGKHANGKAIIRSEENTYLAEAADLEMYYAPKPKKELNFSEAPKAKTQGVGDSIDLHIEVLNPKTSKQAGSHHNSWKGCWSAQRLCHDYYKN